MSEPYRKLPAFTTTLGDLLALEEELLAARRWLELELALAAASGRPLALAALSPRDPLLTN